MSDAESSPRTDNPPAAPPQPARGGLRPGARLGAYRVVGLLGRGGMGAVYLAERTQTGDGPARVALKVLPPHWLGEPERVLRFRSEQALLARLDHPNVVRAFGGLERDPETDLAFYAMELVLGSDLGALLRQRGRFPPAEAARIGAEVAAALSAAHRERIVHRDIKPQNILLDRAGGVRLTDFGLARALDQSRLTRSGTALGTPAYMAPEQADGAAVGPAADLYGLGVVLYELLVGRPPFEAESPIALLLQHRERTPRPPRERRPEVPPELDALVVRLLAKDPTARGDAAEISDALRTLSEDLARLVDSCAFRDEIQHAVDDRTRSVLAFRAPAAGESALETAAPPVAAQAAPAVVGKAAPAPAPSRRVSRRVPVVLGAIALVVVGVVALRLRGRGRGPAGPSVQPASQPVEAAPATPKGRLVEIALKDGSRFVGRLLRYDQDALWVEGPEGSLRRIPLARVRSYRLSMPAPPSDGP